MWNKLLLTFFFLPPSSCQNELEQWPDRRIGKTRKNHFLYFVLRPLTATKVVVYSWFVQTSLARSEDAAQKAGCALRINRQSSENRAVALLKCVSLPPSPGADVEKSNQLPARGKQSVVMVTKIRSWANLSLDENDFGSDQGQFLRVQAEKPLRELSVENYFLLSSRLSLPDK